MGNRESGSSSGPPCGLIGGALATWSDVVRGRAPLISALSRLGHAFGAEVVAVSRLNPSPGAAPRIMMRDFRAKDGSDLVLSRSFARSVLGSYIGKSRDGSVWSSIYAEHVDPALSRFQVARGFAELIVIPLCKGNTEDFIELHRSSEILGPELVHLEHVAVTLSSEWKARSKNTFVEKCMRQTEPEILTKTEVDILSFGNPCGLSRTEFRVCHLLRQGLSNERIAAELDISASTLRTHLRNVYGKTDVDGKAKLIWKLLAAKTSLVDLRAARA